MDAPTLPQPMMSAFMTSTSVARGGFGETVLRRTGAMGVAMQGRREPR